MRKITYPILCAMCMTALGCGSLREVRTTYNPDGTIRENVRLSARSFMSKEGLRGLNYTITGGTNDIHRSLSVDVYDRDVSTNAAPVIAAGGTALGNAINAVATP